MKSAELPRTNRMSGAYLLTLYFVGWAGFYFVTTLVAIANFAWRHPMYDQWRTYQTYLTLPFPQNVLQLENGHRPIIPNLFRVAEIQWFNANQWLQIGIGTTCLLLTFAVLATIAWREKQQSLSMRAANILLISLGLMWLANARMLLHGNESLHVYLLVLAVTLAAVWTYRAGERRSLAWFGAAVCACVVAMFCFGPGVASFPAIIVLAIALRLPTRWLLLPIAALAACLYFYFILPGHEGVRDMIVLRPMDSLLMSARWLSSPWVNGWLGFADPPLYGWMGSGSQRFALHVATANAVSRFSGVDWHTWSMWIGLAGMSIFMARCAFAVFSRQRPLGRLEAVMLALGMFGLATALVIGLGRLDYLIGNPVEIYSDRYLVWPSLFWMTCAVQLLQDAWRWRHAAVRWSVATFVALVPAMLLPTQSAWAEWGAILYRNAEQMAAAARSGVIYPAIVLGDPSANRTVRLATLQALRTQRLSMFTDDAWTRVGTVWNGKLVHDDAVTTSARSVETLEDLAGNGPALHIEGYVESGLAIVRAGQLAILDDGGTIAGLAEFSFIAPGANSLRLSVPHKRGFDGYVKGYDPQRHYRLVSIDFARNEALDLAAIAPLKSAD